MTAWFALNPVTRAVGLALVEFVWQGALIGATAASLLFALRRATAQARYVIGCLALAGMAAAPLVTVVTHLGDRPNVTTPSLTDTAGEPTIAARDTASSRQSMPEAEPRFAVPLGLDRQLPLIVLAWGLGVAALAVHLLSGWRRVRQLRAAAVVLHSGVWPARLARLAGRLGTTTRVRLVESAGAAAPFVIGWLRPAIVVPTSALAGLTPSELEAILAHELMHIRRADYLVNLIQCVIEILLFYHPVVWWVSRQIRVEREHCCDDLAATAVGDPVSYASALASLEALRGRRPALAMAATGGDLLVRVRRLVSAEPPPTPTFSGGLAMCTVMTVFMLILGGQAGQSSSPSASAAPAAAEVVSTPVEIGEPQRDRLAIEVQPGREVLVGSSLTSGTSDRRAASALAPVAMAPAAEPSPGQVQATPSEVVILVEDGHGVLPGANVRLTSTATGDVSAVTSAAGRASFGSVPAGDYLLSVESRGFRAARVAVSVPTGSSWLQVRLAIGALSEAVNVSASSEPLPARPPVVVGTSVTPSSAPASNLGDQSVVQARRVLEADTLLTTPKTQMTPGDPPPLSGPVRVGGDVAPPRKLTDVTPGYPSEAVAQGLQGIVILEGTVASDGSVQDLRTLRGPSVLAAAAAEAVSQWRYTPTTLNRVPVQVPVTITVNFALR